MLLLPLVGCCFCPWQKLRGEGRSSVILFRLRFEVRSMLSLQGRNAVICGLANKRSIAWAIAQRLGDAGARLAITYQNERLKQEAQELIASLPGAEGFQCDVSCDPEIERLGSELKQHYER